MTDQHDVVMHQCRQDVERVGWHCTGVFGDPETGDPPFAYTTGLRRTRMHPELVITGLDPTMGHRILAAAVELIEQGARLDLDGDYDRILTGYPVRFREVDPTACTLHFGVSNVFYGDRVAVRRLQLLWPDRDGRFPGEPGCDPMITRAQKIGG